MALAALVTWVITAGLGFFMLSTWVKNGGTRTDGSAASHFRPPVVFGHFLLAAAGLIVWVIYVVNDSQFLAWVAFVDLLVVAVIGDTLVIRWFKDRQGGSRETAGVVGLRRAPAGSTATRGEAPTATLMLAEQRIPHTVVIAHGIFAVATVVLVLLAALEIGGS
jgi:hypothetical protein